MSKWNENDIPDLAGKTALVTGANSGLGFHTARALAAHGARVIMACRTADKAERAADDIRARAPEADLIIRELDLADLKSVKALAEGVVSEQVELDWLINNAGVMAVPHGTTQDGFEMQMGVNHLGHFALTGRLLDRVKDSGRIVCVASAAHRWTSGIDFDDLDWSRRRYKRWQAYGDSKLANLLFMFELGRRCRATGLGQIVAGAHPGYADTHLQFVASEQKQSRLEKRVMQLGNAVVSQPAHMGALPSLYAATASGVDSGDYIGPGGFMNMRGHPAKDRCRWMAQDHALADRLWAISEELTGVRYLGDARS